MGTPTRGKLEVQEGSMTGQAVEFMFNPGEYSITKANKWEQKAGKGTNVPKWEFSGGDPRTMQIELFFDSYLRKGNRKSVGEKDVRSLTNQLFNFMMTDSALKGKYSKMANPPMCLLIWGQDTKNQFKCFITN